MHLGFRISSRTTDEHPLLIDCPKCQTASRPAHAADLRQWLYIFYIVPIFFHKPTVIECECGASLISKLRVAELLELTPSDLARVITRRVSPILKALVYGGIIVWILPVIGTVWMGIAYVWARTYTGWIRTLSLVLLLLSILPTIALFLAE